MKQALLTIFVMAITLTAASAQDFKGEQKKQEKIIEKAYKQKKVSETEYYKLLREQEIIKEAMAKYEADGILTAKEKNVIHSKLQRAEKRLVKYRTNGEIY